MSEKILTKRQEAKLNMYEVVELQCDENPTILATNIAFKDAFEEMKPEIVNIKTASLQSGAVITGFAAGKKISKQSVCQKAAKTAGQIFAFAAKTGNAELKAAVDFSVTDLMRMKDGETAIRCQIIHDLGVQHKDELTDYGVTTTKLADLQTAINGYAQTVPRPRSAITNRATIKANIKAMFERIDAILSERMDRLVDDFAQDFPDFVATYKSNRKIVDPKPKKKKNGNGEGNGGNPPA